MGKRTIIPFGPQHPVLPEPIHLDLVMEDETVVEAIPSIGYVHRGLEKLVEKAGGIICGRMAILAEGDAIGREDLVYLEPLPLFNADGTVLG